VLFELGFVSRPEASCQRRVTTIDEIQNRLVARDGGGLGGASRVVGGELGGVPQMR
jgi:hypothetical protein